MSTPLRLYMIDDTGKCTGKKRDYPSEEHFRKYGIGTYHRYNMDFYNKGAFAGTRAKLCFLNGSNKWEKVSQEKLEDLISVVLKVREK